MESLPWVSTSTEGTRDAKHAHADGNAWVISEDVEVQGYKKPAESHLIKDINQANEEYEIRN